MGQRRGHRTQRISIAAAWCCGQVLVPLTFEGYCDSELIKAWFAQELCPALRPALRPGQVVILDNASFHRHDFHRHDILRALLENVGCTMLPLPAYSPDLNKIESTWNAIKRKIELDTNSYPCCHDKVDAAFL